MSSNTASVIDETRGDSNVIVGNSFDSGTFQDNVDTVFTNNHAARDVEVHDGKRNTITNNEAVRASTRHLQCVAAGLTC